MTASPLNPKTPAQGRAHELASDYGLENHGVTKPRCVYWNLPAEALYEELVFRGEGRIVRGGAVAVGTGRHTSRAALDKFIVREPSTEDRIWWGEYNRPLGSDTFELLLARMLGFLQGRDLFVQDLHACAQPEYRLPIRIVTEHAWHSLFARNMFLKPESREAYRRHVPELTILCAPSFEAHPPIDGTRTGSFIALDFARKLCLIGGTQYAGELKKSVFTVLNYLLPLEGVLSMHCSANVDDDGSSALFFGLSGTGKTTLSADPRRGLVGDDEHGWSDEGIFNHEDGCYAKAIRLSPSAEPQIHSTTHRFGTVLENVVFDEVTRRIDLDDDALTENTRASYPLDFIEHAVPSRIGRAPELRAVPDVRRAGRAAAARAADARAGPLPLRLGLHLEDRGHGGGPRRRAGDRLQHVLRRAVHGPPPVGVRRPPEPKARAPRLLVLARQHGLGGRAVRGREADQHRAHAHAARRRALRRPRRRRVPHRSDLRLRGAADVSRPAGRGALAGPFLAERGGVPDPLPGARSALCRELPQARDECPPELLAAGPRLEREPIH